MSSRWIACALVVGMAACAQPTRTPEATGADPAPGAASTAAQTTWTISPRPDVASTTPPEREPDPVTDAQETDRPFTVAIVSDLNGSYGSTDYGDAVHTSVRWIRDELHPDLVLSTGDMVAGQKQGLDYEGMWLGFHAAVTRPLAEAGIPFAVTPGNHDASAGAVFSEERVQYIDQWQQRRPDVNFVDDSFYPLYYAFEAGGALFISLDATITGPIDHEQRAWLRDVLTENDEYATKVVFGHVPLYPFSNERKTEILDDAKLESLLQEHDVDVMATGHHHAYYPGRRDALRVVGMACLGSGRRTLVGDERESERSIGVLRIYADGRVEVDAFRADGSKVERDRLPERLNEGRHRIWRDDVEQANPPDRARRNGSG
ncbi:MAG: metallophosphoesterase family protein [Myxococcota bacterium]